MSASPNTTRVTMGGSASEIADRVFNSSINRSISGPELIARSSQREMPRSHSGDLQSSCGLQGMPAPIFIDEILRGLLAQRPKPLRAIRSHPDEIAGFDRVPRVAEFVDAT